MTNFKPFMIAATAGLSALLISHRVPAQAVLHEPSKDSRKMVTAKASEAISIERISAEPETNQLTDTLRWSPDGLRAAWMHLVIPDDEAAIKAPQQEIWAFSPETGSSQPEHPVLLASTTKVTNALRGTDAPIRPPINGDDDSNDNSFLLRDFAWSQNHASLLLIGSQSLAWLDLASEKFSVVVSGEDMLTDVSVSPDGRTIAFIRSHSLCIVDAHGGPVLVLAKPPHEGILEGESDWPYRNELHLARAYSWSPDSSSIAYLETDDRLVAKYTIQASDGNAREIVYPKAGGELPVVRVLIKRLNDSGNAPPLEIKFDSTKDFYLPRMTWLPDGRHLAVERIDRHQQNLDLFLTDALTGKTHVILSEKDKYWINLSDDLYFLKDGKGFLWSSERTGFRHLYLYDLQGKQLAQLTHGEWEVTSLNAVDEERRRVYFTATEKSPLERHLYSVSLDGSAMEQVTHRPGTHEINFAPNAQQFADCYSNQTTPPRLSLVKGAQELKAAPETEAADGAPSLRPLEFLTIKMHQGMEVHAFMLKPPSFDPARKYPVIVYMAGGPGEQLIRDAWSGATGLWQRSMAEKGYIVFALDNQGTAGRGHFFEEPIHLRLGAQELGDQRDGVSYLKSLPYVDSTRIGVYGWGYGGFLVVHAMLDRPVLFKAGFAGAPIVDWHFYDAVFAERYLDDPVVHRDGWNTSIAAFDSRSTHLFKGPLMVAQGTEDELVHMNNMLLLQDHLLNSGKSVDVLLFADRGHHIEDQPARRVLFSKMTEFFVNNL